MPKKLEEISKLPKIRSLGSQTAKNVDWDTLREEITGKALAYSSKDILEMTKHYSLIELFPLLDKEGEAVYDPEGMPVMNPPISQMRARDFLVKEWQKGRALKYKVYEERVGMRVYYLFPLHAGQGKVRLGEDGCHPDYEDSRNRPEPKVIQHQVSMEDKVLEKYRARRQKEKEAKRNG